MLLLEVNNLYYSIHSGSRFGTKSIRKHVLTDVTFSIPQRTTLGLLGASGSGKSTLAKCIAGILQPTIGTINIHGFNIHPMVENRKSVASEIQMLFQASSASLDPTMTIRSTLMEGLQARKLGRLHKKTEPTVESLLNSVGLPSEIHDRLPHQLSGGQKQRVALARAISVEPSLLILDEPTSALDPLSQIHILQLLKSLQHEIRFSMLFIAHDVQTTLMFCDMVAVLYNGAIVEMGSREQLKLKPRHSYTQRILTESGILSQPVSRSPAYM